MLSQLHTHHAQTHPSCVPVNCNLAGLKFFTSPRQPLVPLLHHKNLVPPYYPSYTCFYTSSFPSHLPFSNPAHALGRPLPSTLPVHSRTEIPSQSPPSDCSAPPNPALPRPPAHKPRPLARRLGMRRSLSLLSPAPYRHAQGQPDPERPRGDPRAEACGRGVPSPPQAPVGPPPSQSPPPGNARGG